jgi:ADP-ribose pyrophosphatase
MKTWKTLNRRQVADYGRFLKVELHTIELPDGQLITDWTWLVTPDFVNMMVVTTEGRFLCFRQTKYAVEGESLAAVGGYIEPGELPLDAARRELMEETGYEAKRWIPLGEFPVDANRGAGKAYFFIALEASQVAEPDADDLEEQEPLLLTQDEVEHALRCGEFKVLPWCTIMVLGLHWLGRNSSGSTDAQPH